MTLFIGGSMIYEKGELCSVYVTINVPRDDYDIWLWVNKSKVMLSKYSLCHYDAS